MRRVCRWPVAAQLRPGRRLPVSFLLHWRHAEQAGGGNSLAARCVAAPRRGVSRSRAWGVARHAPPTEEARASTPPLCRPLGLPTPYAASRARSPPPGSRCLLCTSDTRCPHRARPCVATSPRARAPATPTHPSIGAGAGATASSWTRPVLARSLHVTTVVTQDKVYGGLADEDRIYTNLYGEQDFNLPAAEKRVSD